MGLRVIIIDDDENCRTLLAKVLERKGYEVISLTDPCACPLYMSTECRCPHEHACGDLLITDNRMPRMTGLEFVEHQSRRGCKGIVHNKMVLSGSWSEAEVERAARLGCTIMHKPYKLDQLLEWVVERQEQIPPGRKLIRCEAFL